MNRVRLVAACAALLSVGVACSGSDGADAPIGTAAGSGADDGSRIDAAVDLEDVRRAIDAVEAERGSPQRYFEVTVNAGFTNVFVAVDGDTAAIAYVYLDGELQPPAPKQTGAQGQTFVAAEVTFDVNEILASVSDELPNTTIEALSVYGDGVGAIYVLAGRSSEGGALDIVVTADGAIVSVDPI